MLVTYYQQLFLSSNPNSIEAVLDVIPYVVTKEMNSLLNSEFSKADVDQALQQMAPFKAPGPDGMPPPFYQHYWHLIGDDVAKAVIFCLQNGHLPPELNQTYLTLIPKVKNLEKVYEFRPIALCNVLYKLVPKVFANKSKKSFHTSFQKHKVSSNQIKPFQTTYQQPLRPCTI